MNEPLRGRSSCGQWAKTRIVVDLACIQALASSESIHLALPCSRHRHILPRKTVDYEDCDLPHSGLRERCFGKRCICPIPKTGSFDEMAKMTLNILPTKTRGCAPQSPETDEHAENGGYPSDKTTVCQEHRFRHPDSWKTHILAAMILVCTIADWTLQILNQDNGVQCQQEHRQVDTQHAQGAVIRQLST